MTFYLHSLKQEEIVNSHRVGKPNRDSRHPRQIIARLSSVDVKFRLVKNSRNFKNSETYSSVHINEDLTKFRNKLMYIGRQLVKRRELKGISSSNGNIRVYDFANHFHIIREEADLVPFGHVMQ